MSRQIVAATFSQNETQIQALKEKLLNLEKSYGELDGIFTGLSFEQHIAFALEFPIYAAALLPHCEICQYASAEAQNKILNNVLQRRTHLEKTNLQWADQAFDKISVDEHLRLAKQFPFYAEYLVPAAHKKYNRKQQIQLLKMILQVKPEDGLHRIPLNLPLSNLEQISCQEHLEFAKDFKFYATYLIEPASTQFSHEQQKQVLKIALQTGRKNIFYKNHLNLPLTNLEKITCEEHIEFANDFQFYAPYLIEPASTRFSHEQQKQILRLALQTRTQDHREIIDLKNP